MGGTKNADSPKPRARGKESKEGNGVMTLVANGKAFPGRARALIEYFDKENGGTRGEKEASLQRSKVWLRSWEGEFEIKGP